MNKSLFFSVALTLLVWLAWYGYCRPDTLAIVEANWPVSLTMVFGSFIAGATSEGGGAIAFPVFTKVLQIAPLEAKVFSLAIQSVGMTAATLTIVVMRIDVAWRLVLWASLGGAFGVVFSTLLIAPMLEPALLKMLFTSMVVSFALTLAQLNWRVRAYNRRLPLFGWPEKAGMLLTGVVGGGMTGLVGNGIDIICFSVMVLLFRLTEKVSTPTSVILMAINSLVGFMLHVFVIGDFNERVEAYWLAAIPVVVVGAPLGAYCCTKLNNKMIATVLIALILIELFSSLCLIPLTGKIGAVSLTVFVVFSVIYYLMSRSLRYRPVGEEK
ncbi:sulfite exporter TauE/SafE family protein [Methylomarinum sp. Ch1-1]|uniref:Probable membrane transporter protein n=1 Tax=Methylomarinum roseum TaxID=3067653 RepID=A0AAU7NXB8_9GAMM|nr:sulfite exporter TauE/SafE family protein [Methylomarinum sp. Ch1-1]MDP4522314.1 sulfite exporter TauE/SafE family protein [Methylomarinum sp. Ch1-1]